MQDSLAEFPSKDIGIIPDPTMAIGLACVSMKPNVFEGSGSPPDVVTESFANPGTLPSDRISEQAGGRPSFVGFG